MAAYDAEFGQPRVVTASTVITPRSCQLIGLFVTAANATSRLWIAGGASAGSVASATVVRKFTASAGKFFRIPLDCPSGLTVMMAGSAQTVTAFYKPNAYAPA